MRRREGGHDRGDDVDVRDIVIGWHKHQHCILAMESRWWRAEINLEEVRTYLYCWDAKFEHELVACRIPANDPRGRAWG